MMTAPKYSLFHAIYLSFYSRDLYRDVARNWRGFSLSYLLALLGLYCIPLVLHYVEMIGRDLDEKAPHIIHQVPDIRINGGKASVSVAEPYYIYTDEGKSVFMIIDTTGTTRTLQGTGSRILLTQSQVMIKVSPEATHTVDLVHIDDMTVDRRTLYEWIESFRGTLPFILYPLFLLFTFAYRLFYVSSLSVIGLAVNRWITAGLPLKSIVRLSVVALTPSLMIETLTMLFRIHVVGWWFVGVVISIGYLVFAIRAHAYRNEHPSS